EACQDLAACFEELEFVPTPKGPFIERLRRKLDALARGNSNEILDGDVTEIMMRLAARRIQLSTPPTSRAP
ncbi:MAG: hypothetical protein GY856_52260, partial [bacterium]|nr:hypothetical protein [bacterium]